MRIAGLATVLLVAAVSQSGATAAEAATITNTVSFARPASPAKKGIRFRGTRSAAPSPSPSTTKKKYTDQSKGLTFKGINIAVTGLVVFSYDPSQNWFTIGANSHWNQYIWSTNDFSCRYSCIRRSAVASSAIRRTASTIRSRPIGLP
jgi:hypothetical protein